MTRRHILAAPIAALLGKASPPRIVLGFDGKLHPPGTVWREVGKGSQFFPATNLHNWRPILEQINLMPDPREGKV